jgi:hypothetical protein
MRFSVLYERRICVHFPDYRYLIDQDMTILRKYRVNLRSNDFDGTHFR